jgi:YHS domain-containing protein
MRKMLLLAAGAAMSLSMQASAGELGDHCAWGLVNGKKVKTDCAVNQMGTDGKVYCFSNEQVKWNFMADLEGNTAKAKEAFKK